MKITDRQHACDTTIHFNERLLAELRQANGNFWPTLALTRRY
jgi:hypothetical protein